jgi:hypothetical protein
MNNLTEDQEKKIKNMGALGYQPKIICSIMDFDLDKFEKEFANEKSKIKTLYIAGKNQAMYLMDLKLFEMAQSGDIKALEKLEQRKKQAEINEKRNN